ncbi:MAG: hypothetical protein M3014_11665 [Chloroflexota bacterium]|nr:hypothetical protein [Chloroflexota bacterium]
MPRLVSFAHLPPLQAVPERMEAGLELSGITAPGPQDAWVIGAVLMGNPSPD